MHVLRSEVELYYLYIGHAKTSDNSHDAPGTYGLSYLLFEENKGKPYIRARGHFVDDLSTTPEKTPGPDAVRSPVSTTHRRLNKAFFRELGLPKDFKCERGASTDQLVEAYIKFTTPH